jgi:hypothetical protein
VSPGRARVRDDGHPMAHSSKSLKKEAGKLITKKLFSKYQVSMENLA